MKDRKSLLLTILGGAVALLVLGMFVKMAVWDRLQKARTSIASARATLAKLRDEQRAYLAADEKLKALAKTVIADTVEQASAKSGEMLNKIILQSGLRELEFSRTPFGPRKLRGAQEIGWSLQGEGGLSDVVDLLFLLQESPYLHRLESVTITPGDLPGQVRVSLRYLTLVFEPMPPVPLAELEPRFSLYSPERKAFDELQSRDILRPYIKAQPTPPPGARPGGPKSAAPPPPAAPPGPESFKVVSLSEWAGRPEIHVLDQSTMKTVRYKAGDSLAGGLVTMVDYRPMPKPGNEALLSYSRVILKIGTEYWAVERGQTLADKYRLKLEQLPENLPKL